MNKEELKNFHYTHKNEIQFEYNEQIYNYNMDALKEIFITARELREENQKLKEEIEKQDSIIDKQDRDIVTLSKGNKQLKEIINKAIEYIENEYYKSRAVGKYTKEIHKGLLKILKGGSNENNE